MDLASSVLQLGSTRGVPPGLVGLLFLANLIAFGSAYVALRAVLGIFRHPPPYLGLAFYSIKLIVKRRLAMGEWRVGTRYRDEYYAQPQRAEYKANARLITGVFWVTITAAICLIVSTSIIAADVIDNGSFDNSALLKVLNVTPAGFGIGLSVVVALVMAVLVPRVKDDAATYKNTTFESKSVDWEQLQLSVDPDYGLLVRKAQSGKQPAKDQTELRELMVVPFADRSKQQSAAEADLNLMAKARQLAVTFRNNKDAADARSILLQEEPEAVVGFPDLKTLVIRSRNRPWFTDRMAKQGLAQGTHYDVDAVLQFGDLSAEDRAALKVHSGDETGHAAIIRTLLDDAKQRQKELKKHMV